MAFSTQIRVKLQCRRYQRLVRAQFRCCASVFAILRAISTSALRWRDADRAAEDFHLLEGSMQQRCVLVVPGNSTPIFTSVFAIIDDP